MNNQFLRAIFLTLIICASQLSMMAYDFCVDGIYYKITDPVASTVEVTFESQGAGNYKGDIVIPRCVEYEETGYVVNRIGDHAFYSYLEMTGLEFSDLLTSIGEGALFRCSLLEEITVPESVTEIGRSAFAQCTSLKTVSLPENITEISDWLLEGCSALENVSMSSKLKSIGLGAFYSCTSLKSMEFSNTLNKIASRAFFECTSLETVTLPEAVTAIEECAFARCSSLKEVRIGSQIDNLSAYAFSNCTSLEKFTCLAAMPPRCNTTNEATFNGCGIGNATLYIPQGSAEAYSLESPWKDFASIVEIPPLPSFIVRDVVKNPCEESSFTLTCTVKCKNVDVLYVTVEDESNQIIGNYQFDNPGNAEVETEPISSLCNSKVTFRAENETGTFEKVIEFSPQLPDGLYYAGTDGRIFRIDNEGNKTVLNTEVFPHTFQLVQIGDRIYGASAGEKFTYTSNSEVNGDGKLFYLYCQNPGELETNIVLDNTGGDNNKDPYGLACYGEDIYVFDRNVAVKKFNYSDISIPQDYPSWLENRWISFYGNGWSYGCIKSDLQITEYTDDEGNSEPVFWLMMNYGGEGLFRFVNGSIWPNYYRIPSRLGSWYYQMYLIGIHSTSFYLDQPNDHLYLYIEGRNSRRAGIYRINISSLVDRSNYSDYDTMQRIDASPVRLEGTENEPAGLRQLSVDANGEYLYWCYRAPASYNDYDNSQYFDDYNPNNPMHRTGIKRIKLGQENPVVEMVAEGADGYGVVAVNFKGKDPSSVIDIIDESTEDGPMEYFNLQGLRIDNPQPGSIVIRRQGNQVQKIRY